MTTNSPAGNGPVDREVGRHAERTGAWLKNFVANSYDPRAYMRQPFARGGWIYATNGHIAVRVPKAQGIDAEESPKPANIPELFEKHRRDDFVDVPSLPAADPCKVCNGSGVGYKCSDCGGDGEFDYGRHSYDCKECNGTGQADDGDDADKEPCQDCGGTGEQQAQAIKVGNWHYDRRYLAKIIGLPAFRFAPPPDGPKGWDDGRIAYFTFDGGEGLLMPMRT